jgi:hypothetical protein
VGDFRVAAYKRCTPERLTGDRKISIMVRHCSVLLAIVCLAGPSQAATWSDGMFEELSKDFGSVPRGATLAHPFRFTNNTDAPVHIRGIRVSCACVTATVQDSVLMPGKATVISTTMDTRCFSGVRTVTIIVQIDQPRSVEVRLWVHANSRDDVTVTPDAFTFGHVKRGSCPVRNVTVALLGNGQWQISGVQCDSNYVQTDLREIHRDVSGVSYQLAAQLRSEAPVGKWFTDIWLETNNPATPRVRLPLTVEIESALSLSPATVDLGQVPVGRQAERKVIVRGVRPFKITEVHGDDDVLRVRDTTFDSRSIHVLAITFHPSSPGDLDRSLRILTDMSDDGEIEFHANAHAHVVP